jgi:hypothetical protein
LRVMLGGMNTTILAITAFVVALGLIAAFTITYPVLESCASNVISDSK